MKRTRDGESSTRDVKPSNRDVAPSKRDVEPSNRDVEPSTRDVEPSNRDVKPSNRDVKPSNRDVKPSTRDVKPSTRDVKPSNRDVEPSNRDVEPSNRDVKPSNRDVKPSTRDVEPSTRDVELTTEVDQWHVAEEAFQQAKAEAEQLGFPGDKPIEFLCAKGIDPDWGNKLKPTRFDFIMIPPNAEWVNRRDTLHGILGMETRAGERAGEKAVIPEELSFHRFVEQHPEWAAGNSFVVFRDHRNLKGKNVLIQRQQIFGTCAIHAPVVMQHYLVAMANKGPMPTVDIPLWLRKHAPKATLEDIIFGQGTNAEQVLRYILLPKPLIFQCLFDQIPKILRRYGPVLLPMWSVTAEFQSPDWQHVGARTAPFVGYHSMLVVGERSESGKTRLLLQNWWRDKQFVEVDKVYYDARVGCEGMYVIAPQPHIPASFATTHAAFSVSAVDGAGVSGFGAGPAQCV